MFKAGKKRFKMTTIRFLILLWRKRSSREVVCCKETPSKDKAESGGSESAYDVWPDTSCFSAASGHTILHCLGNRCFQAMRCAGRWTGFPSGYKRHTDVHCLIIFSLKFFWSCIYLLVCVSVSVCLCICAHCGVYVEVRGQPLQSLLTSLGFPGAQWYNQLACGTYMTSCGSPRIKYKLSALEVSLTAEPSHQPP